MVPPDETLMRKSQDELLREFDSHGARLRRRYHQTCDECPTSNPTNLQLSNVRNARRRLKNWLDDRLDSQAIVPPRDKVFAELGDDE